MATPLPLSVLPPPPGRVFRTRPSRGLPPAREKSWLRSRPPQGVILRGLNGVTVWLHLRRGLHALRKRAAGLECELEQMEGRLSQGEEINLDSYGHDAAEIDRQRDGHHSRGRAPAGGARSRWLSPTKARTPVRWRIIWAIAICNQRPDTLRLRLIDLRDFGRTSGL
jgi:hypothetical protein